MHRRVLFGSFSPTFFFIMTSYFFLFYDRGDFIVPNFEEIWPSGKKKETGPPKGTVYILGQ